MFVCNFFFLRLLCLSRVIKNFQSEYPDSFVVIQQQYKLFSSCQSFMFLWNLLVWVYKYIATYNIIAFAVRPYMYTIFIDFYYWKYVKRINFKRNLWVIIILSLDNRTAYILLYTYRVFIHIYTYIIYTVLRRRILIDTIIVR